jgi:hypothetical protein
MPNSTRVNDDPPDAIDLLETAHRHGRPIVPFLGAGLSAGSGFPLVDEMRSYLLKVRFYLRYGGFRQALQLQTTGRPRPEDPENSPSRYLTDFGWPNMNQLNVDLYRLSRQLSPDPNPASDSDDPFARSIRKWTTGKRDELRRLLSGLAYNSNGDRPAQDWIDRIAWEELWAKRPRPREPDIADRRPTPSDLFYQYLLSTRPGKQPPRWGIGRWRLETAARFAQLEDIRLHDSDLALRIQGAVWSHNLFPRSDWTRQLMQLSEGKLSLIDALIASWGLRYSPALSHIMLAQLVRYLNIRLLLSLNFDPYIEQSLRNEGLNPRVIEVTRDEDPPDVTVIQQSLALIKLHGGGHSLRLGERLDYALDDDTRRRLAECVQLDALLLVIGFSGYERRMMQLIEHLTLQSPVTSSPRVLWMHFESDDKVPPTVVDLEHKLKAVDRATLLTRRRLTAAGDFLFEAYQRLGSSYPKTSVPIPSLPKRINDLHRSEPVANYDGPADSSNPDGSNCPIHLFIGEGIAHTTHSAARHSADYEANPSIRMSRYAHERTNYHLIWVDLEDHHTVSGVVTEIVDEMRVHDPDLSPLILPIDELPNVAPLNLSSPRQPPTMTGSRQSDAQEFDKAVRFLHRALRRGQYFLAFDSLESFGREHTSHHGLPTVDKSQKRFRRIVKRVDKLLAFLKLLLGLDPRSPAETQAITEVDFHCAISCDEPTSRHVELAQKPNFLRETVRTHLCRFINQFRKAQASRELVYRVDMHPKPKDAKKTIGPLLETDRELSKTIHTALKQFAAQDTGDKPLDDTTGIREVTWLEGMLPFNMLAVARRPRSLTLINQLLSEFLPQRLHRSRTQRDNCLQKAIDHMLRHELLQPMQGGFYWIPHRLHEQAYKQLSGPLSPRRKTAYDKHIVRLLSARSQHSTAQSHLALVERLVFVSLIHSNLARFYYLHVFRRTRDVNALYEYFYHRLSTLRYLKLLHAYCGRLRVRLQSRPSDDLRGVVEEIVDAAELLFHYDPLSEKRNTESTASSATRGSVSKLMKDLDDRLRTLRRKLIQAMLNVFDRENDVFFSDGSADTWIAWMLQIEMDLKSIVSVDKERHGFADAECCRLAERMRLRVQTIAARLYRDKRHWRGCLQLRGDMLKSIIAKAQRFVAARTRTASRAKRGDGALWFTAGVSLNHMLPLLQSLLDKGREMNPGDVAEEAAAMVATFGQLVCSLDDSPARLELIDTIRVDGLNDVPQGDIDVFFESLIDVGRCLRHLTSKRDKGEGAALELLKAASTVAGAVIEDETLAAVEQGSDHRDLRRRSTVITHMLAFERHRLGIERLDAWSQTPNPEVVEERQKVMAWYRELTDERHKTRGTDSANLNDFFLRRCQFRVLQAQCLLWLGRHRDALDVLNNAETGLSETTADSRSVLALIWEHRAHTRMRIADSVVRTAKEDREYDEHSVTSSENAQAAAVFLSEEEQRRRWSSARGRLDDAGQALGEAENLLRRGRRLTGQWIRLYAAKAQLGIEELLLAMWKLEYESYEPESARMRFFAEVHNILHHGLEAVRGGWDCIHAPGPSNRELVKVDRAPWLARWVQLMIGGYVLCHYFPDSVNRGLEPKVTQVRGQVGILVRHQVNENAWINQQHNLAYRKPPQYATLWQSLNESVGLERLLERESGSGGLEPRWRRLISEVESFLSHDDNACMYMRERALAIMNKAFYRRAEEPKTPEPSLFEQLVELHCTPYGSHEAPRKC